MERWGTSGVLGVILLVSLAGLTGCVTGDQPQSADRPEPLEGAEATGNGADAGNRTDAGNGSEAGVAGPQDPEPDPENASQEPVIEDVHLEAEAWFTGTGSTWPVWRVGALDGCSRHELVLPELSRDVVIMLSFGSPAQDGAGILDLSVGPEGEGDRYVAESDLSGQASLELPDEASGVFSIHAVPRGAVVEKAYAVTVSYVGEPTEELEPYLAGTFPCDPGDEGAP